MVGLRSEFNFFVDATFFLIGCMQMILVAINVYIELLPITGNDRWVDS